MPTTKLTDRTYELLHAIIRSQMAFPYSGTANLRGADANAPVDDILMVVLNNMGQLSETVRWAARNQEDGQRELHNLKSDVAAFRRLVGPAAAGVTHDAYVNEEPAQVSVVCHEEVLNLCRQGKQIEAIKALRASTGCSLLGAKRYTDRVRAAL